MVESNKIKEDADMMKNHNNSFGSKRNGLIILPLRSRDSIYYNGGGATGGADLEVWYRRGL